MADQFEVDISRWVERAKRKMNLAPQAIALALLERLQELTPVVTGTLRAGWQLVKGGPTRWDIINNVVYARRINDGFVGQDSLGRSYDQKGEHMVEQVILETPQLAKKAVDRL
jgi:Bacteriophage HK97-gp10, putative tail-component